MVKSKLQMVAELADDMDCSDYSGRAMYSKTCLGITTDTCEGNFISQILEGAAELFSGDELGESIVEIAGTFRAMRTDSMGRGTIYYFPGTPYGDEDSELEGPEHDDRDEAHGLTSDDRPTG
jgi:hypothetical protein